MKVTQTTVSGRTAKLEPRWHKALCVLRPPRLCVNTSAGRDKAVMAVTRPCLALP